MPELPEVETTRRGIEPHLVGETILHAIVRNGRLRWPVSSEIHSLSDRRVISVQRRAKYLLLELESGWIIIHLGMLTENQITDFQRHYKTESGRFHLLPPGIYPDRKYDHQIPNARAIYRQKNGIDDKQLLVLQVGSDFKRKGVDRSIEAVSALPEKIRSRTQLMV